MRRTGFRSHLLRLTGLVFLAMAPAFTGGCAFRASPTEKLLAQRRSAYQGYAEGDSNQARQALEEVIRVTEKASEVRAEGQTWALFLDHARLYALEQRLGNESQAAIALVKARYWYLRRIELYGLSADKIQAALAALTPEKCIEMADRFDKAPTEGKGPRYLRELRQVEGPGMKEEKTHVTE